jgi:hypothetical protein
MNLHQILNRIFHGPLLETLYEAFAGARKVRKRMAGGHPTPVDAMSKAILRQSCRLTRIPLRARKMRDLPDWEVWLISAHV